MRKDNKDGKKGIDYNLIEKIRRSFENIKHGRIKEWNLSKNNL